MSARGGLGGGALRRPTLREPAFAPGAPRRPHSPQRSRLRLVSPNKSPNLTGTPASGHFGAPLPRPRSYPAIIELTRRLNRQHPTARGTQLATRAILGSLFPSWLPGAFGAMFSRPLPAFSCRLNALATALTCQWLMGPCKVNDVEIDGGEVRAAAHAALSRQGVCSHQNTAHAGLFANDAEPRGAAGRCGILHAVSTSCVTRRRLAPAWVCWWSGAAIWRRPAARPSA